MGTDILAQVGLMKGIEISVAVDLTTDRVLQGLEVARDLREPVITR